LRKSIGDLSLPKDTAFGELRNTACSFSLKLTAASLVIFMQMSSGIPQETRKVHMQTHGDYMASFPKDISTPTQAQLFPLWRSRKNPCMVLE